MNQFRGLYNVMFIGPISEYKPVFHDSGGYISYRLWRTKCGKEIQRVLQDGRVRDYGTNIPYRHARLFARPCKKCFR